jgi:hypothetical protein
MFCLLLIGAIYFIYLTIDAKFRARIIFKENYIIIPKLIFKDLKINVEQFEEIKWHGKLFRLIYFDNKNNEKNIKINFHDLELNDESYEIINDFKTISNVKITRCDKI